MNVFFRFMFSYPFRESTCQWHSPSSLAEDGFYPAGYIQMMPVNTQLEMGIALCRGMNIFLFYINYHKMVALGVFLAHGGTWHLERLSSYISVI